MSEEPDYAVRDLFAVVELGLERLEGLLTDQERGLCQRILSLPRPPARLFARLSTRRRLALRVDALGVPEARVDRLVALGLLAEGAPWRDRLAASPVPELRRLCAARGLSVRGKRAELLARLFDTAEVPADTRWVWRPHHRLIRRLERAALLRRYPERGRLVAERLGHLTWPEYTPTGGPVLWRDRSHLLAWEALLEAIVREEHAPGRALVARATGLGEAPGRLSLVRRLDKVVLAHADGLRRAGEHAESLAWLDALRVIRQEPAALALRRSRALEALGRPAQALEVLRLAQATWSGPARLAVARSGRRLARSLRTAWIPDPPLQTPKSRVVRLRAAEPDHRPRWHTAAGTAHVEAAVQSLLAAHGRVALRAEGGLLRTLFALLFHEALFVPVPGQLPVRRLSGPLDLGTPHFAARRPQAIFSVLDAIRSGEAPERVAQACARFDGVQLAGRARDLSDPGPWVAAARTLGPAGLRALAGPLLARGWSASRGVPDLLLVHGPEIRLEGAHPSRVGGSGALIEVKGPGDTLSDDQRLWIDRLMRAGVPVEVWRIEEGR